MFFKRITRIQACIILFLASAVPLMLAYISQYGFGLEPCILCLYQRVPYAIMLIIIVALMLLKRPITLIVWCFLMLIIVGEVVIAAYHVGVERGIITEGVGCVEVVALSSVEALRAQLLEAPVVSCNEPAFLLFDLSMAAWNVIYATFLGVIMLLFRRSFMAK